MIFSSGRILDESEFRLPINDRLLEHGLGLFETLRTWNGSPVLLSKHLARLIRSARALDLPLDESTLPDRSAVAELIAANDLAGDVRLRITLSGGSIEDGAGSSVVWMRTTRLDAATSVAPIKLLLAEPRISWCDPLARHKTINYWVRKLIYEHAKSAGGDDGLIATHDGRVWESSRANLFLVFGDTLVTPGIDGPIVPGVMRSVVVERARAIGMNVIESDVTIDQIERADEVFLTNSVRGVISAADTPARSLAAPGPRTIELTQSVLTFLNSGAENP